MANQKATSVLSSDGVTKDDLMVAYGEIQGTIAAAFVSIGLRNTNYTDTPTRGGTVHVKRMKSSVSQDYGTARAAAAANNAQNNGVDVKIDTDKEIAEEMSAKDIALYQEVGGVEYLRSRQADFGISMGEVLENDYFLKLQTDATTVDVSGASTLVDKLELLIQTIEGVENDNVKKVDRSMLVLTLAPAHFDDLEAHVQSLPNPRNGGVNADFFRRVEVIPAVRQGVDAIIQVRGAVAQPVVMGNFKVNEAEFSADWYAYLPYFFGTKVVMPDLAFKAALVGDISA
jgi:hypothetical protein